MSPKCDSLMSMSPGSGYIYIYILGKEKKSKSLCRLGQTLRVPGG